MTLKITQNSDGTSQYSMGAAGTFSMPTLAAVDAQCVVATVVRAVCAGLADLADKTAAINDDTNLSQIGRERKIGPLQKDVVLGVAGAHAQVDDEDALLSAREAELYRVPVIDPTHAAAAIEDREMRDWLRGQSLKERAALFKKIQADPVGSERMLIAILRSPLPQAAHEVEIASEIWRTSKRLGNPGEAEAIDAGRANVEWARRGIAQLAGLTRVALHWDGDRIARAILSSEHQRLHAGVKAFGIDPALAARVKRHMAVEASRA